MTLDYESFRRQETALILFNLAVLAALFLIHALLSSVTRRGAMVLAPMLIAFGVRFLMQVGELIALQSRRRPLSARATALYAHASIWMHLVFAWLVTMLGDAERSHYIVLMLLPIVAAGFRFSLAGVLGVAMVGVFHSFFEVWFYHQLYPPLRPVEFFNSATISLIYLLVAGVVWRLADELRRQDDALRASMSELEQTRDELIAKEKLAAVGRLSSAIAHEIRNPIGLISSSLAVVHSHGLDPLQTEMCSMIGSEVARLAKLTGEFLSYARNRPPQRKRENVRAALEYLASLIRPRAEELGIAVSIQCPADLEAEFDAFQINQALLNLALNAIQASPAGGRVVLSAQRDGGVILAVENNAGPIEAAAATRIFEPFFTTRADGTGLGLPIAGRMAENHGGRLELAVNEPGRVRFELRLPGAG